MKRIDWDEFGQRIENISSHHIRTTIVVAGAVFLAWSSLSAIGLSWGPSERAIAGGRELFVHEWQPNDPLAAGGDGLGPVFNAKSCVACHFQGGVGGAGPNENNVQAFEALPTSQRPELFAGVIHADATSSNFLETAGETREQFPIIEVKFDTGCGIQTRKFDPLLIANINTPALFGAGLIDRISDGAIRRNRHGKAFANMGREFQLDFNSPSAGIVRELSDGRVGKFGWKAQFATVEDFVAAACAVEVGLTNPKRSQDLPRRHTPDDEAELDLNGEQFYHLVSFVGTLPQPEQILPADRATRELVHEGESLFNDIGCAECHTPNLGGVEGMYSDLLLHVVEANGSKNSRYNSLDLAGPLPENHPRPNQWKTPPLWGVADTAPYFHDGGARTLKEAIRRHQGESRQVTDRFDRLAPRQRNAIISFLESLRAPASARPVTDSVLAAREEVE